MQFSLVYLNLQVPIYLEDLDARAVSASLKIELHRRPADPQPSQCQTVETVRQQRADNAKTLAESVRFQPQ